MMNKVEREQQRVKLIEEVISKVDKLTSKVEELLTKLEGRDARESSKSHSTNSEK
jgi:hypothetical protein